MARTPAKKWRSYYRNESVRYDERRYASSYGRLFARLHHEIIAERLAGVPPAFDVLEIACGTGHVTVFLQQLGLSPVACDLTPEMMEQARTRCGGKSGSTAFLRADAFSLPFGPERFDVIVTTRFLHLFHSQDQDKILAECARILRPGGLLLADFDNWSGHLLMAIPHTVYNLIRYRRFAADTHYNSHRNALKKLSSAGFIVDSCDGIGGTHLFPIAWASQALATTAGRLHRRLPFRIVAHQFLITARRR